MKNSGRIIWKSGS